MDRLARPSCRHPVHRIPPTAKNHQRYHAACSQLQYGLVLEGDLTIEIDGVQTVLHSGDIVSLKSTRLHKIWNYSDRKATTIWFNLDGMD